MNDGSLWTDIYIQTRHRESNSPLDNFLSLLGMQMDRTANLLLDVDWTAQIGDRFFVATLQLIHEKAPFSRWRTLNVDLFGRLQDDAPWASLNAFTNLESLVVWHWSENSIHSVIDRMITSRLKVLDVRWPALPAELLTSFAKSLTWISFLRLERVRLHKSTPFLPANVVNLQLDSADDHPFPLIRT